MTLRQPLAMFTTNPHQVLRLTEAAMRSAATVRQYRAGASRRREAANAELLASPEELPAIIHRETSR